MEALTLISNQKNQVVPVLSKPESLSSTDVLVKVDQNQNLLRIAEMDSYEESSWEDVFDEDYKSPHEYEVNLDKIKTLIDHQGEEEEIFSLLYELFDSFNGVFSENEIIDALIVLAMDLPITSVILYLCEWDTSEMDKLLDTDDSQKAYFYKKHIAPDEEDFDY